MNYRHTEPKLCHRRRQIETPTVFNNVEEIPGAKEKFLPSPPDLESVCAHRAERWRAVLLCSAAALTHALPLTHWSISQIC